VTLSADSAPNTLDASPARHSLKPAGMAPGKRLLMEATARLAARSHGAEMISLRELAREAGLNHNTFYRHFNSLEDVLHAIVDEFGRELRQGLSLARAQAPSVDAVTESVMGWLFDFADAHRDVFVIALRERYGPPGPIRDALQMQLDQLVLDMLSDLKARGVLPALADQMWLPALRLITEQAFHVCGLYLQAPELRSQWLAQAKGVFDTVILGTLARLAAQKSAP
jgi:TetR/AcrR family transcriptional regulator, fatty acid biosynthesis regulator